jgi:hypothetical protein
MTMLSSVFGAPPTPACFLRPRDLSSRADIRARQIFSHHVSLAISCGNFSAKSRSLGESSTG